MDGVLLETVSRSGNDCQPQVLTSGSSAAVWNTSAKLFPTVFTDHSVESILASDTTRRQTERVWFTNLTPSGGQDWQRDVSTKNTIEFLYPALKSASSSRFAGFDDSLIPSHQIASSLGVRDDVERMTMACHNVCGLVNNLNLPWQTDQNVLFFDFRSSNARGADYCDRCSRSVVL